MSLLWGWVKDDVRRSVHFTIGNGTRTSMYEWEVRDLVSSHSRYFSAGPREPYLLAFRLAVHLSP